MKSLPNNLFKNNKVSAFACACLILGLLLTPVAYIAIGSLSGFSAAFSLIALPPLALSLSFLLFRFFKKNTATESINIRHAIELTSWLLVFLFLFFVSNFTLLTTSERVGLFSTLFLVCTIVSIPLLAIRPSALIQRVNTWPQALVITVDLVLGLPAVILTAAYLLSSVASL
ncbi:hypothetical protein [Acidovorax sp. NCPPB 3576]|uniref:hypothetical protein n=1 Tax=Acidovorax sp. NCPPB 3576 TaxID=2940488 RepID=UPI00234BEFD3|nr:hypothetical protein [Acidovorax sp. NCPPB 3576]WCM89703.1 hypothetical protein M5C98_06580 [Acidovorax sp. NCPPB 3576]